MVGPHDNLAVDLHDSLIEGALVEGRGEPKTTKLVAGHVLRFDYSSKWDTSSSSFDVDLSGTSSMESRVTTFDVLTRGPTSVYKKVAHLVASKTI